jgi:hypothetical protein
MYHPSHRGGAFTSKPASPSVGAHLGPPSRSPCICALLASRQEDSVPRLEKPWASLFSASGSATRSPPRNGSCQSQSRCDRHGDPSERRSALRPYAMSRLHVSKPVLQDSKRSQANSVDRTIIAQSRPVGKTRDLAIVGPYLISAIDLAYSGQALKNKYPCRVPVLSTCRRWFD